MEALNTQLMRLFDWLLWASLQGTVLIVLIVLIQKILRRKLPVHWHYLLWLLLLIRLAVPWLPESKMSIFNLVPRSVQQGRIIESFSQSRSADPMDFYMHARSASDPQITEESEAFSVRLVRKLPLFWLVGTVLIAGYVLMRSIKLWRTVKRERPITDSEILDLLEDCKMQMGVETILGVVVSDKIKSPALFGFIRPRLLLPQGMLETYGFEELRYVFIHELGHLKQRDIYLGWLMALLQVVHWFNPLMWFAFGRMRADREMACDRLVISTMGPDEPPEYGRTIVSLLESFSQASYLPSVAGILEDTCQMERRIKMIADYKKTPRSRWAGAILLLAVLACVVLTDAYVAKADFEFGEPTFMDQAINSPNTTNTQGLSLLHNGLKLYFTASRELDDPDARFIWVSERESADSPWGEAVCLGPYHNTPFAFYPSVSPDDLELYFVYGPSQPWGLMRSTRGSKDEDWSPATPFTELGDVWGLDFSPDGLTVYFDSMRSGGYGGVDIWMASRETGDAPWGEPVNLGPNVNSSSDQFEPSISNDGLALFFSSGTQHYMCVRATTEDDWDQPIDLGLDRKDGCLEVSTDGSTLYFDSRGRSNSLGLKESFWQMSILPIVDFNDDGNINTDDLLILIGYWGQNEPLCDIGPMPYGDGIVDMADLEVFMSYWEKENIPEIPEEEL